MLQTTSNPFLHYFYLPLISLISPSSLPLSLISLSPPHRPLSPSSPPLSLISLSSPSSPPLSLISPSLPCTVHSSNDLPFLVHCLLGHDRQLRLVVSTHVRWLERLLAAFEVAAKQKCEDRQQNAEKDPEEGQAYCQQASWDSLTQLNEIPPCGSGLHCPLPNTFSRRCLRPYESVSKVYLMKPLFHFANYFFPLSTTKGKDAVRQQDGASLVSPSQRAAISYVNKFLKSR